MRATVGVIFALLLPSYLSASFHLMNVKEVYAGSASDPNARYVMLQMWTGGQNFVSNHVLSFFDAAESSKGSVTFGNNVANGADQATILIATPEAQTLFGVTPDFVMSANMLVAGGGKVCFETIDCVSWGNYSGSSTGVGTPFNAAVGIPAGQAIRRRLDIAGSPLILDFADDTGDSANDFRAVAPYPISNAGQAPPATTFSLVAPANAAIGSSFDVTAEARTAQASIATAYAGTVHFTSDDPSATLPADYTFISADRGVHVFSVTLNTAGSRLVTVSDTGAAITGNAVVVVRAGTTTMLTTSGTPSTAGESVTFMATVTSPMGGTITGTVAFKDGPTTIGSATLEGSAIFTTSNLNAASHSMTAVYGGDANFNSSTSDVVTQVVTAAAFGPPLGFSATATSSTSVGLQWLPLADAMSYEVYRSTSITNTFTLAATSITNIAVDGLPVAANTTYLYKVRALGSSGASGFSAIDAATTTVFTDAGLVDTVIKADHILQLRTAVNAMRTAANRTPATFSDSSLADTPIKAMHIAQLRTAIDAARNALGLSPIGYVDTTLAPGVTTIKKDHVLQLRTGTQ